MADVRKAIEFMLHQEESALSGTVTNAASDNGGQTRFGLCAKWHPALVAAGFFNPEMAKSQALALAEETYQTEYAVPLRLDRIGSDAVACGVLSFAVLDGIGSALRVLRAALCTCGFNLQVTTAPMDDATFKAEEATSESQLLQALVQQQKSRCEHIAANDPTQRKWIRGWKNRADQVLALVKT
jgi:lysozyme family protein